MERPRRAGTSARIEINRADKPGRSAVRTVLDGLKRYLNGIPESRRLLVEATRLPEAELSEGLADNRDLLLS